MVGLRPTTKSSTFTFWQVPTADLPADWTDARRRIAEQERTGA